MRYLLEYCALILDYHTQFELCETGGCAASPNEHCVGAGGGGYVECAARLFNLL